MENATRGCIDCSICGDVLTDPRPLPCGHSFCGPPRPCLISLENSAGSMTCAICRDSQELSASTIKPLYGIRDFIRSQMSDGPACCYHNVPCRLWCADCDVMICQWCVGDYHDRHACRSLGKHFEETLRWKEKQFKDGLSSYCEAIDHFVEDCDETLAQFKKELDELSQKKHSVEMARHIALGNKVIVENYRNKIKDCRTTDQLMINDVSIWNYFICLDPKLPPSNILQELKVRQLPRKNLFTVDQHVAKVSLLFKSETDVEVLRPNYSITVGGYKISLDCFIVVTLGINGEEELSINFTRESQPALFLELQCLLQVTLENNDSSQNIKLQPEVWSLKDSSFHLLKVEKPNCAQIYDRKNNWLKAGNIFQFHVSILSFMS